MSIQILNGAVVVAVEENRSIVAGEDDNRILRQAKAVERSKDFGSALLPAGKDCVTFCALWRG